MSLRKTNRKTETTPAPITHPVPDSVVEIAGYGNPMWDTRRKLREIERHYRDEMRFVVETQPLAGAR